MRRLLLTAALALYPMLALADEHIAGQWRADLAVTKPRTKADLRPKDQP